MRKAPFQVVRLDKEIADQLKDYQKRILRRGDLTPFVNEICDKYSRGMLVEAEKYNDLVRAYGALAEQVGALVPSRDRDIKAARVQMDETDEQRQAAE